MTPGRPPYGNVPTTLANFDVSALAPVLPVLTQLSVDDTMALLSLAPMINATWVKTVLPYFKGANVTGLGEFAKPLLPLVQSVSVKSPSGPGGRRPAPPCLCPRAPPAYTFCAFAPAAAAAAAAAPALASPTSSPHPLPCLTTRP